MWGLSSQPLVGQTNIKPACTRSAFCGRRPDRSKKLGAATIETAELPQVKSRLLPISEDDVAPLPILRHRFATWQQQSTQRQAVEQPCPDNSTHTYSDVSMQDVGIQQQPSMSILGLTHASAPDSRVPTADHHSSGQLPSAVPVSQLADSDRGLPDIPLNLALPSRSSRSPRLAGVGPEQAVDRRRFKFLDMQSIKQSQLEQEWLQVGPDGSASSPTEASLNKRVRYLLLTCKSLVQLQRIVTEHKHYMGPASISCACVAVLRLGAAGELQQKPQLSMAQSIAVELLNAAERLITTTTCTQVCSIIYTLGRLEPRLRAKDLQLVKQLLQQVQPNLFLATPTDLMRLVQGLGGLQYIPPVSLLDEVCKVSQSKFPFFSPAAFSALAAGLASLNHRPSDLWLDTLVSLSGPRLEAFDAEQLSRMLWAVTKFNYTPNPVWQDACCGVSENMLGTADIVAVTALATAFRHMQYVPPEAWIRKFLGRVSGALDQLEPFQDAQVLTAVATWKSGFDEAFLRQHLDAISQRIEQLNPDQLSSVVWALSELQYLPDKLWLQAYLSAALTKLREHSNQNLVNIFVAFARWRLLPPRRLLRACLSLVDSRLQVLTPTQIAQVLQSLSVLNYVPQKAWTYSALNAFSSRCGEGSQEDLAQICYSLPHILPGAPFTNGVSPTFYSAIRHLVTACESQMETFGPSQLFMILLGLARVKFYPGRRFLVKHAKEATAIASSFTKAEKQLMTRAYMSLKDRATWKQGLIAREEHKPAVFVND